MRLKVHVLRYQASHLRLNETPELLETKLQGLSTWFLPVQLGWIVNLKSATSECGSEMGQARFFFSLCDGKPSLSFSLIFFQPSRESFLLPNIINKKGNDFVTLRTMTGLEKGIRKTWKRIYISLSVGCAHTRIHVFIHTQGPCTAYIQYFHPQLLPSLNAIPS